MTPEVSDQHLHELERLNKEIESVKQEVEQEQRRLSNYTAAGSGAPAHQNRGFYGLQSSADQKNPVQTRKYLVDNSRPRTDLEYDPLSNFSAALRSYSSSGKKSKKLECRSSKAEESAPQQVQTCGFLEDAREDGVLVIDEVPEDPSARVQKHVGGKPPLCVQENVKMSTALHSSLRTPQETGPSLICGAAALWSSDPNVQNRSQVAPEQPGGAEKPDLQQRQTPERSSAPPPPPQKPPPVGPQENPPPTSTVSPSEDSRSRAEPSGDRTVIEINSSPEDEEDSSYLDVELSDSDPMEECYRIFMEANDQQHLQEVSSLSTGSGDDSFSYKISRFQQEDDTEKLQTNAGLEASAGKKRVAHDAKNSEVDVTEWTPELLWWINVL